MTLRDVLLTAINTQADLEAKKLNGPVWFIDRKGKWIRDGFEGDPHGYYLSVEDVISDDWQIVEIRGLNYDDR